MWLPPPLPRKFHACERDLGSEKVEVRASAVMDLVRHTRDPETRARALELLGKALKDPAARVRASAAVALADGDGGHELVPDLIAAVDDDDDEVRQLSIAALGELLAAGSSEARVRSETATADRAIPRLQRALEDSRPSMRYQATIALARVATDEETRVRALLRASSDDDMNVRYLAMRLAEEHAMPPPERLRVRAIALLDDEEPDVAAAAAIYLGQAGDEKAKPVLRRVVRGETKIQLEDEREAVELTGKLGMRDVIPDLERRAFGMLRFVRDTTPYHAMIALARMDHPRAVAAITGDLGSRSRKRREAAVVAAGRAHIAAARERIAKLDVSAELREEALRAFDR